MAGEGGGGNQGGPRRKRQTRKRTKPEAIRRQVKVAEILELRLAGWTQEEIAEKHGYCNSGGVAKAIKRALRETIVEPAGEVRKLHLKRLERLLRAVWPGAVGQDCKGRRVPQSDEKVEKALKILKQIAELKGLDRPPRSPPGQAALPQAGPTLVSMQVLERLPAETLRQILDLCRQEAGLSALLPAPAGEVVEATPEPSQALESQTPPEPAVGEPQGRQGL